MARHTLRRWFWDARYEGQFYTFNEQGVVIPTLHTHAWKCPACERAIYTAIRCVHCGWQSNKGAVIAVLEGLMLLGVTVLCVWGLCLFAIAMGDAA